ncbi:hypothetical protein [Bradyrhizobium sp. 2TAF24]
MAFPLETTEDWSFVSGAAVSDVLHPDVAMGVCGVMRELRTGG